ncbi:MAG: sigma-70 family RNA polymerase sigma factor [Bacteroidota bacterium]
MIKSTDSELVSYYQKTEDLQAISLLMDRYSDAIVGLSMRYLKNEDDVRDFANDMYMKLVDKLRDADVRNFRAWLLTTVNNRLNDLGRKIKVRKGYVNSFQGRGEETIEENLDFGMDHHLIASALDLLSEKEQRIIRDLYFKEKSYQDIMEEMDLSFNQVRGTRDRAIKKLKSSLGSDFGQYFKD